MRNTDFMMKDKNNIKSESTSAGSMGPSSSGLKICDFMMRRPHTIGADQTLDKAERMMTEYGVNHLPVRLGGKLIGILSDRDIAYMRRHRGFDVSSVKVEEACTLNPYVVSPETSLKDVCSVMANKKIGSALVVKDGEFVGIFTWINALHSLSYIAGEFGREGRMVPLKVVK